MTTEVVMPQMGESLSEGTITRWLKQAGERVEQDEPLFEITTDKVDTEVPAPTSGLLERILVGEGETVSVGTVVAVIMERVESAARGRGESSTDSSGGHFRDAHEPVVFRRREGGAATGEAPTKRSSHSPAVRALAAEHDLSEDELDRIEGSGRDGRVTRRDVERHLERRTSAPTASEERRDVAGTADSSTAVALYRPEPGDRLVPMSDTRKRIAEHLLRSQQVSAPVTSFTECDMQRIVRYRDELGARFEQNEGVPLTFLPFVAMAVVGALKEFPIMNASVVDDHIALRKHVHLGIAVSVEEGLIVPVVERADEMSFLGLARSIDALLGKARGGGLDRDDVSGASFTITSPGMYGGLMGTPMISQPQVAVLGLGSVQKKPVVVDDAIAIRPVMVLALTFDHRVIDGPTGFQFLESLRGRLESFDLPEA